VTIYNSDWSSTVTWANSKQNEILYCGYRWDPESGLYQVRYRYHHPTLGRWLQRDKLAYIDGHNLYAYVGASPTTNADPLGLMSEEELLSWITKHLTFNHTEEAGRDQFTVSANATIVPDCPSCCFCADVTVSGTYARKLGESPAKVLTAQLNTNFTVVNFATGQGILLYAGPDVNEVAQRMFWNDPELVANYLLAEAALAATKPTIPILNRSLWEKTNLSVSITGSGRVCWDGRKGQGKIISNFCKVKVSGAWNVGSTTKAPIEGVKLAMGITIEVSGEVDLCEGKGSAALEGRFDILIDLPGDWTATLISAPLVKIEGPEFQHDKLKVLKKSKLPKCGK